MSGLMSATAGAWTMQDRGMGTRAYRSGVHRLWIGRLEDKKGTYVVAGEFWWDIRYVLCWVRAWRRKGAPCRRRGRAEWLQVALRLLAPHRAVALRA